MPYVIENRTGRERFVTADLLQSALDSGGFSLAENQQILMDDGKGSVVKVSSTDYSNVVNQGGRPLTSDERMTVGENLMKEARYDTPEQRLKAGALGAARGLTLGLSDVILEGGDTLPVVVDEQERKALEYFNQAESVAGEVMGMGAGLLATGGLGAIAKGGAVAAKGASSLGALRHAASPFMTAAKFTPSGMVGLVGRKAAESTAKTIAKKIGAQGLANSPAALKAVTAVAPLAVQGAVEEALIGGAQAAAEFDYDGNADDWASAVRAGGIGGALGGVLGGAIALAPGAGSFAKGMYSKGLSVKPSLSAKANDVIERTVNTLSNADAKTVKETFEGSRFSPDQIKKAINEEGVLSVQKPEELAPQLKEIATTGPRSINDLFFDPTNGIRKQTVDKIAPGTKGLKDLEKEFDADAFQEAYIRFDAELGDIADNTSSYLASAMRKDEVPSTVLGQELKKLHQTLLPTPEVYDRIVKDLAKNSKDAVKRLRQNQFIGPITESAENLIESSPGLPGHLADTLIDIHEKTRAFIYKTVGRDRLDPREMFTPTREYFQSALKDRSMFGEAADFYGEVNDVYRAYATKKNDLRKLVDEDPSVDSVRELMTKAQDGDGEALKKINAYKELAQETDNYAQNVISLTNQKPQAYAGPITKNIKAYNSLEGTEEAAELIRTLSPSRQSGYVSSMVDGVKQVSERRLRDITREGVKGFLALSALGKPVSGSLVAGSALSGLARSATRAVRDPYRQLSRLARLEQLKDQAQQRFNRGVKKVVKSIGKEGQNVEDSLKVASKASRVFMGELARTVDPETFGFTANPEDSDARELEKKAFASLSALAADPALLDAKIEEAIGPVERSPQIKEALKSQTKATILSMNIMKPREIIMKVDPLTGTQTVSGPDYAFDKMNQLYAVAQNPIKVISSAAESKTLTREMAAAFRALHPQAYTSFVSSVQESLLGKKGSNKTTYSDRLMLSTLFDIPMEASVTAPVMTALQSTYQEAAGPEPRPQRGLASLKSQVTNTMTPSQRAMQA